MPHRRPAALIRRAPQSPAAPPRRSLFLPGLGVLVALAGVLALLDVLDVVNVPLDVLLAVGLVLVGVLVAVGAFYRGVTGLVPLGLVVAVALVGVGVASVGEGGGIGHRTYRPVSAADLDPSYDLRIGDLDLDLTGLELGPGETRIDANVGIGHLLVRVPEGVAVVARGHAGAGQVDVLGRTDDGVDTNVRSVERGRVAGGGRLVIDADADIGDVEIRRAGDGS